MSFATQKSRATDHVMVGQGGDVGQLGATHGYRVNTYDRGVFVVFAYGIDDHMICLEDQPW